MKNILVELMALSKYHFHKLFAVHVNEQAHTFGLTP